MTKRKLPPLNALRAFEAAARHVNFSRAAEELDVTHGAVSRQVAALEDWLKTELFQRGPAQLRLTEAGAHYARQVTSAFDRLSVASSQLFEQAAPTALRISAPPTFMMRWLISRMSRFQRSRPDVEIHTTTSIAPIDFSENDYDLAIRSALAPIPNCRSEKFITELVIPVCHIDLLEKPGLAVPQDLARHTLISHATAVFTWIDWLKSVDCATLKPAAVLNFEQMYLSLQAASEGLGVALAPLFLVVDDIVSGRLAAPFGLFGAVRRSFYYAYQDSRGINPAVPAFCEWLKAEGSRTEQAMVAWAEQMGWTHD
ncbi:MAG: transcriptional regulator GcvA [Lautropia sp.]